MTRTWTFFAASALALFLAVTFAVAEGKKRNPFDVEDIEEFDADEVAKYAKDVELKGDANDANAEQWVSDETVGKKGTLDGEWASRWNSNCDATWQYGDGTTKVNAVGERAYMLYKGGGATYLIDLKRTKDQLAGRYKNLDNADDAGMIVFKVVGDDRLDGQWGTSGRWDFRRKLK